MKSIFALFAAFCILGASQESRAQNPFAGSYQVYRTYLSGAPDVLGFFSVTSTGQVSGSAVNEYQEEFRFKGYVEVTGVARTYLEPVEKGFSSDDFPMLLTSNGVTSFSQGSDYSNRRYYGSRATGSRFKPFIGSFVSEVNGTGLSRKETFVYVSLMILRSGRVVGFGRQTRGFITDFSRGRAAGNQVRIKFQRPRRYHDDTPFGEYKGKIKGTRIFMETVKGRRGADPEFTLRRL